LAAVVVLLAARLWCASVLFPRGLGTFQVVLLLNAGDATAEVTAHWKDIGLAPGIAVKATDLWTGKSAVPSKGTDSISATLPTHDVAAFRLTPT